jgi:hypothetical protein
VPDAETTETLFANLTGRPDSGGAAPGSPSALNRIPLAASGFAGCVPVVVGSPGPGLDAGARA